MLIELTDQGLTDEQIIRFAVDDLGMDEGAATAQENSS